MAKNRKALLDSSVTAGGMLLQQVLGFVGGVFVAKMLGPAEYGEVSVLRSLLTLIIVLTPLGLDLALFRILPRFDAAPHDQALHFGRFRLVVLGFGLMLALIGAILGGPLLARGVYDYPNFSLHFAMSLAAVPFATDVLLLNAWYRVQGNIVPILLITNYFQPIVRTGLNVLAVYLGYGVIGVVVGTTAAYLASFLLAVPYHAWRCRGRPPRPEGQRAPGWDDSWRHFMEAPAMALNLFASNMLRTFDMVIVGAIATAHAAGEYAVVSNIAQLVPVAALSLVQTLGPAVARYDQARDNAGIAGAINDVIRWASLLASFVFGGIAGFGGHLDAVFGAAYRPDHAIVLLVPLGYLMSATLAPVSYALTMSGRGKVDLAIVAASAVLLVGSCTPLTMAYGTVGAAVSVVFAYTFANVARLIVVSRMLSVTLGRWQDLVPPVVALTLAIALNRLIVPVDAKLPSLLVGCVVYGLVYGVLMFSGPVRGWLRTRRAGAAARSTA